MHRTGRELLIWVAMIVVIVAVVALVVIGGTLLLIYLWISAPS